MQIQKPNLLLHLRNLIAVLNTEEGRKRESKEKVGGGIERHYI
jgi:hypothetical protein